MLISDTFYEGWCSQKLWQFEVQYMTIRWPECDFPFCPGDLRITGLHGNLRIMESFSVTVTRSEKFSWFKALIWNMKESVQWVMHYFLSPPFSHYHGSTPTERIYGTRSPDLFTSIICLWVALPVFPALLPLWKWKHGHMDIFLHVQFAN